MSVSLFRAVVPRDAADFDQKPVAVEDHPQVPAYHAKACRGVDRGDALARVKCKEDWLKEHGQRFLPDDLRSTLQSGCLAQLDEAAVAKLRSLLYNPA